MAKIKIKYPDEHQEQVALIMWATVLTPVLPELDLLYAVPNGGKRNIVTAMKLRAEGVKPGVPDLCLPVVRQGKPGLYIEMKRRNAKPSDVSPEQQRWHARLIEQGYAVQVCKGWDEARQVILSYLEAA